MRLLASIVLLVLPLAASAHGGGLNADGCHTNRKTGDYHCHRAQPARSANVAATTLLQEFSLPFLTFYLLCA